MVKLEDIFIVDKQRIFCETLASHLRLAGFCISGSAYELDDEFILT